MKKLLLLAAVFICVCFGNANAQVVINEFMQSNIDCIMDDLNDFPDSWVELYNAGSSPIDLSSYSLGTSRKASKASKLPKTQINANGYIVIYCDKEATKDGKHTSFRLESGKDCAVYLFNGTEIVDSIPSGLKKQPAPNISYGRKTDAAEKWGYQLTPTPNAKNCGNVVDAKKILGDPVFSVNGKVFTNSESFSVELSKPDGSPEESEIRYTLDGTEPTKTSAIYVAPISINETKIVRAKLFCDGYLSPRSITQSYIKFPRKMTLPIVSMVTDLKYFDDTNIGIYSKSQYKDGKKNYEHDWRRPINIEFFEEENTNSKINQLGETRVMGGQSRNSDLKSLVVYANKRFGEKRLDYEFFPDQRPGVVNFKSILLRNAGNDFDYLYMRDAVIQRMMSSNVDVDWQAWRPAIFMLNGVYKGMLNIRERSNEDNIFTNYNELEDIDMIENWRELKTGTWDNWNKFEDLYKNKKISTLAEYEQHLDVEEFFNVMIANLFFNNLDFPGNNIVFWRPTSEGGRWRVIMKDTDFGLGLYGRDVNYQIFKWLYNNNYDSGNAWANTSDATRLFRRLMDVEDCKKIFLDRFAIYMGDFMNYDYGWNEIWSPMYEMIKTEYPNHRKLYNPWWPNYKEELDNAKKWLKNRVDEIYTQIHNYYNTGEPKALTINKGINKEDLQDVKVSFNGVDLSRGIFAGKYYVGNEISLECENATGWYITVTTGTSSSNKVVEGSKLSFEMPSCSSVVINAKFTTNAIETVEDKDAVESIVEIYDAAGVRRNQLEKGYNIIRTSDGTTKKIWY